LESQPQVGAPELSVLIEACSFLTQAARSAEAADEKTMSKS